MAEAEVGDDVYGEDPTVARLEERAAELLGMEAALFVPSGTMGNAIAIRVLTQRGDEVLVERRSHVVRYELSGLSVLSGVMPRMVDAPGGHLLPEHVRAAVGAARLLQVRRQPRSCSRTRTTSAAAPCSASRTVQAVVAAAREAGLRVHVDGARLWNAAVALGVAPAELRARRRHRDDLPVEGPVRAGRLAGRLDARAHRGGPPRAQAARRRHAPGRRPRRGRAGRARHAGRPAGRGPRARALLAEALARGRGVRVAPVETNIVVAGARGRGAPEVVAALRERGCPGERDGRRARCASSRTATSARRVRRAAAEQRRAARCA